MNDYKLYGGYVLSSNKYPAPMRLVYQKDNQYYIQVCEKNSFEKINSYKEIRLKEKDSFYPFLKFSAPVVGDRFNDEDAIYGFAVNPNFVIIDKYQNIKSEIDSHVGFFSEGKAEELKRYFS